METILTQLKIGASVIKVQNNENITKFYLKLHPGTKVSKLENCATEIALGIKAYSKPIVKVIPEEGLVMLEMLTRPISVVNFDDVVDFSGDQKIPLILGKSHDGNILITDLADFPHLLVAGTTGSGKSVCLHSIISGLVLSGRNAKLVLIDPKQVEMSYYQNIKQLLYPVITNSNDALSVLSDLVNEMETRFKKMSRASVNHISELLEKLPYIVVVIDEFGDLMMVAKKEFSGLVCRLAQLGRACGIHLIIATQHPSVKVISGEIKSNFPARISFKVSSLVNSRVVLDCAGGEKLLGKGDGLLKSNKHNLIRFQGAFLDTGEIEKICEANQRSKLNKIINWIGGR